MGRKNFLFANTTGSTRTGAVIYGLIKTAKGNGLDLHHYLTWLMPIAPALDLTDPVRVAKILPLNASDGCRTLRC